MLTCGPHIPPCQSHNPAVSPYGPILFNHPHSKLKAGNGTSRNLIIIENWISLQSLLCKIEINTKGNRSENDVSSLMSHHVGACMPQTDLEGSEAAAYQTACTSRQWLTINIWNKYMLFIHCVPVLLWGQNIDIPKVPSWANLSIGGNCLQLSQ